MSNRTSSLSRKMKAAPHKVHQIQHTTLASSVQPSGVVEDVTADDLQNEAQEHRQQQQRGNIFCSPAQPACARKLRSCRLRRHRSLRHGYESQPMLGRRSAGAVGRSLPQTRRAAI